jgi:hypothetical protein
VIQVAIVCAKGGQYGLPPCGAMYENLAPDQVEPWVEKTLREHGWYTDEHGAHYCPKRNPADGGLIADINEGPGYRPLGDSGWEARLPENCRGSVQIEIRPQRGGDDG